MRKEDPAYVTLAKVEVNDFIAICDKLSLDLKPKKKLSERKVQWIKLIDADKLVCPYTNKKVSYVGYDMMPTRNPNMVPSHHFNFYSEDGELMTVDHIIPKSKGGSKMDIENLQPMTFLHNQTKSNQLKYVPQN